MSDKLRTLLEGGKKAETPTLDTKSEEDPKLYQDAEGGHAKIDTDKGTEGKVGKNRGSIAGKAKGPKEVGSISAPGSPQERLESTLDALFDGEELSEEFQYKAATIFEAAINERVDLIEEELVEQYQSILAESIEETTKDLVEKLDDYLGYVVEQWMEENELAVENGVRTDVAENFILGLKGLFENSWIDVPDEKYDLMGEMVEVNEELEGGINEILEENIALRKQLQEAACGEVFIEETAGLTDLEVDRLASLTEGIDYSSVDEFRDKVNILRESYITEDAPYLTEEAETTDKNIQPEAGGHMDGYMNAIHRHSQADKTS
jgi:hypothetical protein